MVDHDDRIGVLLDVRQAFVEDAPAQQIDRQIMPGGGGEGAAQAGMVGVHRQAVAHADANAARAWCRRPPRHHIVDRRIGRVDRRHDPELVRKGVVDLEREARIVFIGAERRHHDRAVDTDAVHRRDHFLACGGVEPVRGTGPRPAGMISIEGMNLDVDDWHGCMDLNLNWRSGISSNWPIPRPAVLAIAASCSGSSRAAGRGFPARSCLRIRCGTARGAAVRERPSRRNPRRRRAGWPA